VSSLPGPPSPRRRRAAAANPAANPPASPDGSAGESGTGQPEADAQVPSQRPAADAEAQGSEYRGYKVLLDGPAVRPGLGFDGYAVALAETILDSRAEFAVGIFGSWGSGKTTLMRAIEQILGEHENVVAVWFAAWRYERDPNLLLPLLDVINEALAARAEGRPGWASQAAAGVGRAGQAFLAGLRVSANLPLIQAEFEPGRMIEAIKNSQEQPGPQSFYHAGFRMLRDAIRDLSAKGTRRVVVFVDDLDRCLPENALDVLESMKLFFDVEGCVFVVGLDLEIAERAVALKYDSVTRAGAATRSGTGAAGAADSPGGSTDAGISGSEYLKKLFQVWFSLPPIKAQRLPEFLATILQNSDFGAAQRRDFANNVQPHINVLQSQGFVNPREIKRLINLYTLQLKMLAPRLGASLNHNVMLALLCMSYRPDWQALYEQLAADPSYFRSALREALDAAEWPNAVWLAGTECALPGEFVEYLRGLALPLLRAEDLSVYISLAESTRSTDPWVLEARTVVSRLRGTGDALERGMLSGTAGWERITADVVRLSSLIGSRHESFGLLGVLREQLDRDASRLAEITRRLAVIEREVPGSFQAAWRADGIRLVETIDAALLRWHRYIG
jgi:hypothetical protein